jgi:hypothetical protein
VIAVGSVVDGSRSESGDGDEIGDGIGGEGDMTGDGDMIGDGGRRGGVLDWCVLGVAVVANIWRACSENP